MKKRLSRTLRPDQPFLYHQNNLPSNSQFLFCLKQDLVDPLRDVRI